MHDYKEWYKVLDRELEDHMNAFIECPDVDELCRVEKLLKATVKLQEKETYDLMFKCLEECFGYDREEGEFEDKNGGGEMMLYAIYNAYSPARMNKRGMGDYPTTYRGGQTMGRGYDHGVMNGDRYGERSTDRSMYPYHEYGYDMMDGYMNAYDGRSERMYDSRTGEYRTDGNRDGDRYMNDSRGRDGRSSRDSRRERDSRGRYMNRIYNMADDHDMKKSMGKLTEKQKSEWVNDLESEDGRSGEIFTKQEIESIARKNGIKFEDYDISTLWAIANSLYSDYCGVISKIPNANTPSTWVRMAVAFLEDEDSQLSPDEKAAAYFHNIVDADGEKD